MTVPSVPSTRRTAPSLLAVLLLVAGCLGFAAAWVLVAFARDRQCSWMALLAALDAVFLLRMGRVPPGATRSLLAVAATALTIVLANWGIAAAQIGRAMGLLPWESIGKLGPFYAWTLANLANPPVELLWLAASLVLAALASRRN
ncbi:MAG TPA: hypothetical protein VFF93_06890 [Luteimonas sp.]|jgi:hypothetical protein|nr:hypothetical protein [Luteimonas sp.]